MLKILRKKGVAKKILWTVTIVIIFAFGFGGTAYMVARQQQKIKYAGKIFGKTISFEDYEKAYRDTMMQFMLQYGDEFSKIRQYLDLDAETWNRLILLHQADQKRLKVTDKEIVDIIEQYPAFQRNNKFDVELYNNILRYVFNIRPRPFEEHIRNTVKIQKLFFDQTNSLNLTESEIFDAYKKQNEKIQIDYVLFSSDSFKKNLLVDETEMKKYYTEQKEAFLVPDSINFEYLEFPFPEEKQNPNEEAKNVLRNKADTIYSQLQAGEDLIKTTQENGLEIKNTGFFSMEKPQLNLSWSYQNLMDLFEKETTQFHEPFETPKGIYIVRIKEKKDAYIPSYDEIKENVKNALIEKKAQEMAQQKAEESLSSIKKAFSESKNFEKTVKDLNLELYQTPEFTRGQYLPTLGISKSFEDAAFALTDANPLSDAIKIAKGFCILHRGKYIPINQEEYEKTKENFSENLLTEMRNKSFGEFLTALKLKAKLEDNISKLKKEQQNNK